MSDKVLFTAILLLYLPSWAEFPMSGSLAGTGVWGGTQGCAYQQKAAPGATNQSDEVTEIQSKIADLKKQLATKKRDKKRIDRDAERNKSDIGKSLADDYSSFVSEHIEGARRCDEYKDINKYKDNVEADGDTGGTSVQKANANILPVNGFSPYEWATYCDPNKAGGVYSGVCDITKFRNTEGRGTAASCKKSINNYRTNYAMSIKTQDEIESLQAAIERAQDDLADAKEDALQSRQDAIAHGSRSDTEGGVCVDCIASGNGYTYQKPQTDWANVIANVGTGLAAMYVGYQSNKMVSENNAALGWPSQSYPTWGYGLPYLAAGAYGALGGGTGQGGFGCGGSSSGGMSVGGAFGYPASMTGMNTMGGGIYANGMGPWGMNMGNMSGNAYGYPGTMGGMMSSYSGTYLGSSGYYDQSSLQMMQLQMQYQQQYQQQQLSKYQTMTSLQTEIQNLMYKMQAVQLGYGSTTNYISGTGTSYSSGVLPAPTTSTGTTIYGR
ncbi:MAG: hypothetical protein ACKOX6_17960 [Bdellovibrio sp.]